MMQSKSQQTALFELEAVWVERPHQGGGIGAGAGVSAGAGEAVLRGINLTIPSGGITCLVGPSGSGKSTVLRLLNRLEDPTRGVILFRGRDLRELDPQELRRRVALVRQDPIMLPGTVRENLEAGLRIRGERLPRPEDWLLRMGLPASFLDRPAADLSGGEKQRVALARALAVGPEVLLLDEVTAALDPDSAAAIEALIAGLDLPAIWVSHDPDQVRRVANRVFRIEGGQAREEVKL